MHAIPMKTWQIFRTAVNRKNKKFRSVLQPMTVLEQMTVASYKYNYINKYIFPLTVQCYRLGICRVQRKF